ncbi:MAG TPA: NUDIX domain-containing protein [Syntrophales bacterium]|nr:NUDIX domain-containing protein [Syntrophales bacterium]
MTRKSAGLLLYRRRGKNTEVFLVHPGGPIWAGRDAGAWSIPKGEFGPEEDPLRAARREFEEETGSSFKTESSFIPLKPVKQRNNKLVYAWAVEGDSDAGPVASNTFSLEWPPRSGTIREFPEIDRAAWFTIEEARKKIFNGQIGLLDELEKILSD